LLNVILIPRLSLVPFPSSGLGMRLGSPRRVTFYYMSDGIGTNYMLFTL